MTHRCPTLEQREREREIPAISLFTIHLTFVYIYVCMRVCMYERMVCVHATEGVWRSEGILCCYPHLLSDGDGISFLVRRWLPTAAG